MENKVPVKNIAVIGSGVSGLGAIWALKHSNHRVCLYEANSRLGGHAHAVNFRNEQNGTSCLVDTAFMIINDTTYPNFIAALKDLQIDRTPAPNSLSVSRDFGRFEWGSSSVFAQCSNLLRPSFWRMLFDIVRFNTFATDILLAGQDRSMESIGEYLERERYSKQFRNNYLLPMTASVWTNDVDQCRRDFPVGTLVRFLWNHRMLNTFRDDLPWSMIKGSSSAYINALLRCYPPDEIHMGKAVQSIGSDEGQLWLQTAAGTAHFDNIILATSATEALKILGDGITKEEREILSSFQTISNVVVLHSDISFMPSRRSAWAAYNYMTLPSQKVGEYEERISVTCWMNCLQGLPIEKYGPIFVTINPIRKPEGEQGRWVYEHPRYTAECIKGQQRLGIIQNKRRITFAGAWTNFGFHEDGFTSGLQAAKHVEPNVPINFADSTLSRGQPSPLSLLDHLVRAVILLIQFLIYIVGA